MKKPTFLFWLLSLASVVTATASQPENEAAIRAALEKDRQRPKSARVDVIATQRSFRVGNLRHEEWVIVNRDTERLAKVFYSIDGALARTTVEPGGEKVVKKWQPESPLPHPMVTSVEAWELSRSKHGAWNLLDNFRRPTSGGYRFTNPADSKFDLILSFSYLSNGYLSAVYKTVLLKPGGHQDLLDQFMHKPTGARKHFDGVTGLD